MPLDGLGRMARGAALVLVLMTLLLLLLLLMLFMEFCCSIQRARARGAASLMFNTTRTVQKHGNRAQF